MSDHNTALLYQVLNAIQRLETHQTETIMSQLQALAASVAALSTVAASAEALLSGLSAQLSDARHAIANGDGGEALTRIIHDIDTNTAALSAAVSANTVADTGAVSPVPVATPETANPPALDAQAVDTPAA